MCLVTEYHCDSMCSFCWCHLMCNHCRWRHAQHVSLSVTVQILQHRYPFSFYRIYRDCTTLHFLWSLSASFQFSSHIVFSQCMRYVCRYLSVCINSFSFIELMCAQLNLAVIVCSINLCLHSQSGVSQLEKSFWFGIIFTAHWGNYSLLVSLLGHTLFSKQILNSYYWFPHLISMGM